jgi:uncharacterized protein (TIGR03435 family)
VKQLILRAYGIPSYQLWGPEWIDSARFDVLAKLPQGATKDQIPEMLQRLLAERFGLQTHTETRNLPAFALVVAKEGRMKPAPDDADAPAPAANRLAQAGRILDALWTEQPGMNGLLGVTAFGAADGRLHMTFRRLRMDALAQILASHLRQPVLDRTGLTGGYEATLDLRGRRAARPAAGTVQG